MKDVKAALEGVTKPNINIEQCIRDLEELVLAYKLNGLEMQQVLMTLLGPKWAVVGANYTPRAGDPLATRQHGDVLIHLQQQGNVWERMRTMFQRRTNYSIIQQTKQKPDETVTDFRCRMEQVFAEHSGLPPNDDALGSDQQQLKTAVLGGLHDPIQKWIIKNYVGFPTATMTDFMTHCVHVEKVVIEKKKEGSFTSVRK